MRPFLETVTDLRLGAVSLADRHYGVIVTSEGRLERILLRPWPKLVSIPEILVLGRLLHRHRRGDRCLLYYHQPWRFPRFLVVKYVFSMCGTRYATFRRALEVLDEIARLKRADALLCDLANPRISRQMMRRWGWEPHCPSRWHRHYIRRFYGQYPSSRLS